MTSYRLQVQFSTSRNGSDTAYAYAYDDNGNITSITRGSSAVAYQYNGANELVRENNGFTNQTVVYTYDTWGNITEKKIYAYTTAANPGTPTSTIPYVYGNSSWKDQLTKYNGQTIAYDAMGNPTTYRGKTLTWRGKQLTGVTGTASYVYDSNGLRQRKTVSGTNTDYYYNGSILIGLTKGSDKLRFSYDAAGQVQAVDFNGTYYYYLRNGQGDIVKIIDSSGAAKVEYTYDSWGKKLSCTGTLATTLGTLNPFRYRGYVYDEETGFYYLKSRYYDPETCRFISADVLLSTGQGVLGHNCFAYCGNNPINMVDDGGSAARDLALVSEEGEGGYVPGQIWKQSFYYTMDEAAIAVAPYLYNMTKSTNHEYMAPIYEIDIDGQKYYTLGQISKGCHANVVAPTLWASAKDALFSFITWKLVGFVHSHPLCDCHVNDEFSGLIGDEGAAILTGCCYMIEPKYHVLYKISKEDVIDSYRYGVSISGNMSGYKVHKYNSLIPYK